MLKFCIYYFNTLLVGCVINTWLILLRHFLLCIYEQNGKLPVINSLPLISLSSFLYEYMPWFFFFLRFFVSWHKHCQTQDKRGCCVEQNSKKKMLKKNMLKIRNAINLTPEWLLYMKYAHYLSGVFVRTTYVTNCGMEWSENNSNFNIFMTDFNFENKKMAK